MIEAVLHFLSGVFLGIGALNYYRAFFPVKRRWPW